MCIADKLQIILITYNRASYVKKTFEQLFYEGSPINNYDFFVLDNNSTDNTHDVVEQQQLKNKNIRYFKNKYNLGISGNIAKAMEMANKEYVWIISDDDKYDFSNWNEIEKAINNNEKLICLSRYTIEEKNKNDIAYQLLQLTFIPAIIFKTSLFNDNTIRNSFDNIFTLFPHLYPIIPLINNNEKIYVVNKAIVDNGMDIKNTDCSYIRGLKFTELCQRTRSMSWIVGYVNVCSMIKDKKLKNKIINTAIEYIHGNFYKFCKFIFVNYSWNTDYMQIIDVYMQLSFLNKLLFFVLYIQTRILSILLKQNFVEINFCFLKIKFEVIRYKEGDYSLVKYKFVTIKKNLTTGKISVSFYNK